MSTTTDKVMGGYGEAEHNKALGNLLADAKAMPAAEAMDWKAKCIISKSADGFWDVLSACRGWWWHDMAQKWFEQSPHTTCGAYGTRQDAEEALAACPTPYPNFIPSAIEAAREADIGDGLGLDHDQSRRTMGATLAKMPELSVAQQTERDGIRFKLEREVEHWRKAYNEQVIKAHEACEREQAWKTQYRAERNMLRDMMSTYCPKEVFKEEFPD